MINIVVFVSVTSSGSATISDIVAPLTDADGNPAASVANLRVDFGEISGGPYPNSSALAAANATSIVVNGLVSGHTYYFVVVALDADGNVSGYGQEFSKAIP